jgi:hypothetical protein
VYLPSFLRKLASYASPASIQSHPHLAPARVDKCCLIFADKEMTDKGKSQ